MVPLWPQEAREPKDPASGRKNTEGRRGCADWSTLPAPRFPSSPGSSPTLCAVRADVRHSPEHALCWWVVHRAAASTAVGLARPSPSHHPVEAACAPRPRVVLWPSRQLTDTEAHPASGRSSSSCNRRAGLCPLPSHTTHASATPTWCPVRHSPPVLAAPPLGQGVRLFLFCFVFYLGGRRRAERQRIPSRLSAASTEPDSVLLPMKREIMT